MAVFVPKLAENPPFCYTGRHVQRSLALYHTTSISVFITRATLSAYQDMLLPSVKQKKPESMTRAVIDYVLNLIWLGRRSGIQHSNQAGFLRCLHYRQNHIHLFPFCISDQGLQIRFLPMGADNRL